MGLERPKQRAGGITRMAAAGIAWTPHDAMGSGEGWLRRWHAWKMPSGWGCESLGVAREGILVARQEKGRPE